MVSKFECSKHNSYVKSSLVDFRLDFNKVSNLEKSLWSYDSALPVGIVYANKPRPTRLEIFTKNLLFVEIKSEIYQ